MDTDFRAVIPFSAATCVCIYGGQMAISCIPLPEDIRWYKAFDQSALVLANSLSSASCIKCFFRSRVQELGEELHCIGSYVCLFGLDQEVFQNTRSHCWKSVYESCSCCWPGSRRPEDVCAFQAELPPMKQILMSRWTRKKSEEITEIWLLMENDSKRWRKESFLSRPQTFGCSLMGFLSYTWSKLWLLFCIGNNKCCD